ncbi:MAG: putative quinol monooxygenase [Pseudomonadota bacterium]
MIGRRPVLAGLAIAMLGGPALAMKAKVKGRTMEESELYGLIGKMKTAPGKRDALIALLSQGTAAMPGCLIYLIAEDMADADGIWITEVWSTKAHHEESLKLPAVQEAIAKGRPMITGFESRVEMRPVAGVGIDG